MFQTIPAAISQRMQFLKKLEEDQTAGNIPMEKFGKLCQIPPETGQFISLIAAGMQRGTWLELGTSAGYSALWLTLACRLMKTRLLTFESDLRKIALAQETIAAANVMDSVELITGNVLDTLAFYREVSFCFLDLANELYSVSYELVVPNMLPGGILLADNVLSHAKDLQSFVNLVQTDNRMAAVIVPIGKGVLMARRVGIPNAIIEYCQ